MKGKFIYLSIASLLGVLSSLQSFFLFFSLAVLYFLFLIKYKRLSRKQFFLILFIYSLFFFSTEVKVSHYKTKIPNNLSEFDISYLQDPKIDGDSLKIVGKEPRFNEKILIHYQIQSKLEKLMLEKKNFYGMLCRVKGNLKKPQIARNENEFNYRRYLYQNKIYWILESKEMPLTKCINEKPNLLLILKEIRFYGINYLKVHFPPYISSFSAALVFGDQSLIDPETLLSFQKTGIIHILSISGLHVSLLIGIWYYFGLRVGVIREKMLSFLLFLLPIYAILAGGSPAVVRSVIMLFLVMSSVKWRKSLKISSIDAISLSFSLYLFISPMILYDVGFQLSFSVSFGIILSSPIILKRYHHSLAKMFYTSIIAQISGLPILLFHFYSISCISPIANLIFIPLFSFILLPGVYFLFLFQVIFGKVPNFLLNFFEGIIHFTSSLSEYFSQLAFFNFSPGRPNGVLLMIYMLMIFFIFIIWEKRPHQKYRLILLISGIFLLSFQIGWNDMNPFGEVTMIDVGQGDSIFIHLPFGKGNYLIDTGGTLSFNEKDWQKRSDPFEVGKNIVVPYLKSIGITKIDKLILTHGDMDHIGGAFAIIQNIQVKQILMGDVKEPAQAEKAITSEAKDKGIPVVKVSAGDQWENRNSFFYVLSPEKNFEGVRNRGSITLFIRVGGLSWFSGGDLDQVGEEEIVQKYPNLSFDILKVGHHGSRTSSSEIFLEKFKPKISLISVGKNNHFGHPTQEVLDKLEKIHSFIYRTDQKGAIMYRFFREKGTFSTFLP